MLAFPAPAAINGNALTVEIETALAVSGVSVTVVGDTVEIVGVTDEQAVRQVVEAHTGAPLPEAKAKADRESNLRQAIVTLRQWADDAAATKVTNGNNTNVTQVLVDRVGIFFDRFADLLVNQYGQE